MIRNFFLQKICIGIQLLNQLSIYQLSFLLTLRESDTEKTWMVAVAFLKRLRMSDLIAILI